jgi:hypothetical protein
VLTPNLTTHIIFSRAPTPNPPTVTATSRHRLHCCRPPTANAAHPPPPTSHRRCLEESTARELLSPVEGGRRPCRRLKDNTAHKPSSPLGYHRPSRHPRGHHPPTVARPLPSVAEFVTSADEDITNMNTPKVVAYNSNVKLFFSIIIFNTCDE